jgi:hypothetical protein
VYRRLRDGVIDHELLATADETVAGEPLLAPAMRDGRMVLGDGVADPRPRPAGLRSLPAELRGSLPGPQEPYPVLLSDGLARLAASVCGGAIGLSGPIEGRGVT